MENLNFQAMQESLKQILAQKAASGSLETPQEPRFHSYHFGAAVLSTFAKETLQPVAWDGTPTEANPRELERLFADSSPVRSQASGARWALRPEIRREALGEMNGVEAWQKALAANSDRPDDKVQSQFEAYVSGTAQPLEEQDQQTLAATLTVLDWLSSPRLRDRLPSLPDREQVQRAYDRRDLLRPFEALAGKHFRGRAKELQQLRDYVGVMQPGSVREQLKRVAEEIFDWTKKPPLVIFGPGGVGKSTLIARFIYEHATLPETERFPYTYLDFDRSDLPPEEPLTFLIEAVRQLSLQYPEFYAHCERIRAQWQQQLDPQSERIRLLRLAERRTTANETPRTEVSSRLANWQPFLRDFGQLLANIKVETAPFLLVLDTFEVVQNSSDAVLVGVFEFLELFQQAVPRLRTVISGRAPVVEENAVTSRVDPKRFPTTPLPLPDFDAEAARGYLEFYNIPAKDAHDIFRQFGGNPLILSLAAEVWRGDQKQPESAGSRGLKSIRTTNFFGLRLKEAVLQGMLFTRILGRIEDSRVQNLAHPGLILRRITPDIIRFVLAEPCDVSVPDAATAQQLFDTMRGEGFLVFYDNGVLRHRPDVRRIMVRLLRDEQPDKTQRIQESAIAFYENKSEPAEQAEEIYHRLLLGQPLERVESRWKNEFSRYFNNDTLEELGMTERVWLKQKLGQRLTAQERQQSGQVVWERETERNAADYIARGHPQEALQLLTARSERSESSPLFALEAEAHLLLNQPEQAANVVIPGLRSASDAGNTRQAFSLLLLGIQAAKGIHDQATVEEYLQEADGLAEQRGDDIWRIQAGLTHLILGIGAPQTVRSALNEAFLRLSDNQILAHARTMRILSGYLGKEYPALLARVLATAGWEPNQKPTLVRALCRALVDWDTSISSQAGSPPGALLGRVAPDYGSPPPAPEVLGVAWGAWLEKENPARVGREIGSLLSEQPPAAVLDALTALQLTAADFDVLFRSSSPQPQATPDIVTQHFQMSDENSGSISPEAASLIQTGLESTPIYNTLTEAVVLPAPILEQVVDALSDAFDWDSLRTFLFARFGRSLDAISLAKTFRETIYDLVVFAQSQGLLAALIVAAREANPSNAALTRVAADMGLATEIAPTTAVAQYSDWYSRFGALEVCVCRVENNGVAIATGFLISPDTVLTAAVAVEPLLTGEMRLSSLAFRFDYTQTPNGEIINPGTVFRLATSDWRLDTNRYSEKGMMVQPSAVAWLRLAGMPGQEPVGGDRAEAGAPARGWITIEAVVPKLHETIYVLNHTESGRLQMTAASTSSNVSSLSGWFQYQTPDPVRLLGAPLFTQELQLIGMHCSSDGNDNGGVLFADFPQLIERSATANPQKT